MKEIFNITVSFTLSDFIIILFWVILVIYYFYKDRINDFILIKIDIIISLIILILIYFSIFHSSTESLNNLIPSIIAIFLFLIWFLQYRKKTEYEIIKDYFEKKADKKEENILKNIIKSYKVLSPILRDQRNFNVILQNEIYKVISKEDSDQFKKWIQKTILQIRGETSTKFLIQLLNKQKKLLEEAKKNLKRNKDIIVYEIYISNTEYIIKIINDTHEKIFKKETFIDKIKDFFEPSY